MSEVERQQLDEEVEAKQRQGAIRAALVLVLIMLVAAGAAFWYLWNMRLTGLGSAESVNVLVIGAADDGVDALFVATFHPETDTVSAVVLPIDTQLPWSPAPIHLRDTYDEHDGSLHEAVERLLSAPIHHTVRVDFSAFVELVDLVEGVPLSVDSEIIYRDADGQVVFDLQPGSHHLSGEEALLYVRYKGDHLEDETRRIVRQQRFMEALLTEAREKLEWSSVQEMLEIVLSRVETDLDLVTTTRLARFVLDTADNVYALHMLPGHAGEDGWLVDENEWRALSDELFYNPSWETAGR